VTEIAATQRARSYIDLSPSELADIALLFCYLAKQRPSERWRDMGVRCLNKASEGQLDCLPISLYGGLAGIGWTIQNFIATRDVERDGPSLDLECDPLSELDNAISARIAAYSLEDHFDLVNGLVGVGIYLLERPQSPTVIGSLTIIVEQLVRRSECIGDTVTWPTPRHLLVPVERHRAPEGYYNLGVAHGVPGVARFLSDAIASNICRSSCYPLLRGAVQWIRKQQRPQPVVSTYPYWLGPDSEVQSPRLAWCYGDLGIASTLYAAARRLNDPELSAFAISLSKHCLKRQIEPSTEAGLCHGAAGIAHLFNHLWQATSITSYRDVAIDFYQKTLSILALRGPELISTRNSFLDGGIGVALALISATDPIHPWWDQRLMLSHCGGAKFLA